MNNEEIKGQEVLIGDDKLLNFLADKHAQGTAGPHPLQEILEKIILEELTEEEQELFYLRFGEQLAYRQIAKRLGYASHRTFQLQVERIVKKVRDALGRANVRDA